MPVNSNDIQQYSRTLAGLYLTTWQTPRTPNANELLAEAEKLVRQRSDLIPETLRYRVGLTLKEFQAIEEANRGTLQPSVALFSSRLLWNLVVGGAMPVD